MIGTIIATSLYQTLFALWQRLPIRHFYPRPPPWPSKCSSASLQTAQRHLHAISLFLCHLVLLFRSYLQINIMIKVISRHCLSNIVVDSSCSTTKSTSITVISPCKKRAIPTGFRLHQGQLYNLKSSILLLIIAISFFSTSDLASSDVSGNRFVASAARNGNGANGKGATLRCYVCGGSTGLPCEEIRPSGRRSPYVRPKPQTTLDGRKMFENCTDLINNKGCIKQVVHGGKEQLIKLKLHSKF